MMAAVTLTACNQHYPSLMYEGDEVEIGNKETYAKTPLMVFVNRQDFFHVTATRSTGAFDAERTGKFRNSLFHIFAFRDKDYSGGDGLLTGAPDLTKSIHVNGRMLPEFNEDGTAGASRADCLVDGPDYRIGMQTMLSGDNTGELRTIEIKSADGGLERTDVRQDTIKTTLYYSSQYQDVGYNFFGYYFDDFDYTAPGVAHRDRESIWYDMAIDGSQDILCGYAPRITPEVFAQQYSKLGIDATDKAKIINIGGYSTYAAHRDVHPVINMKHVLARLKFIAHPGDKDAKNITINKVEVECPNTGKLVVAHQDLEKVGMFFNETPKARLLLRDASPDGVEKCPEMTPVTVDYTDDMADVIWHQRQGSPVGESLLLPEAEEYKVILHCTQIRMEPLKENGVEKHDEHGNVINVPVSHSFIAEYALRLSTDESSESYDPELGKNVFKAGYIYTVHIGVYGMSEIVVSANVEGWIEDKNPIYLDPDDPTINF